MKREAEQERDEKNKTIEKISTHLSHAHEKIHDYSEEASRLKREHDSLKKNTEVIRKKAEILDRTRRLGYLDDETPVRSQPSKATPVKSLRDPKRRVSQPNPLGLQNGNKSKSTES